MRFFILFFLYFIALPIFGQSNLQSKINEFAKAENLKNGNLGVSVIEVNSGRILATNNGYKTHIPASTLKAVTTASALKILGKEYQFKTELQYDGSIQNGVLNGNLYIKGYGDPTLASDQMEEALGLEALLKIWIAAIQKAGIQKIEGAIIGDASYFKGNIAGDHWQWADLGNYYGSGAWGLNFHENFYYLHFQQNTKLGASPKVAKIVPQIPNLYFINELKSAGKNTGDNAYIYGGPYAYTRIIRGSIPIGNGLFDIKGAIPDAPFFAAHSLLYALESAGISTQKKALSDIDAPNIQSRTTIHTHYSPTLFEIAKRANFKSVNLYCESMIRAIGAKNNADNSLKGGIEVIENYWETQGLDMNGFFMQDGSGLSAQNGITPNQLSNILRLIAKDKALFDTFYESLPIGGRSGTIKYMFKGSKAEANVRVKSGSIARVRAYTGYAKNTAGQLLAFTVIANNYTGSSRTVRKQLETLIISMCQ